MKMTYEKLNTWFINLSKTKPYRMTLKNGHGFYEVVFLYNEYHYSGRVTPNDMEDEIKCQKKILSLCMDFERNIKLRVF